MAKNTRALSGQSQKRYFRDLLRADPGVSADACERLSEACAAEISQIRVRLPLAVRRPAAKADTPGHTSSTKGGLDRAPSIGVQAGEVAGAPAGARAPFDPFAFSLIVVLTKEGPDGLAAKLQAAGDVERMRAIAKAQHVAVDSEANTPEAVCAAIVAGTARRIAHRKAAAS
jgi:hypothetical protein